MALKAKYKRDNLWWKGLGFHTPNKTLDHIPNMSTSQLHQFDVGTDDPTASATMQRLKSNDMQSQQHHLSFLSLRQHSIQVSYLCGPLKQEITYAAMLH